LTRDNIIIIIISNRTQFICVCELATRGKSACRWCFSYFFTCIVARYYPSPVSGYNIQQLLTRPPYVVDVAFSPNKYNVISNRRNSVVAARVYIYITSTCDGRKKRKSDGVPAMFYGVKAGANNKRSRTRLLAFLALDGQWLYISSTVCVCK
jgi:hypothetical protein